MKRYRIGQKKIIACSILAFSAIVAGAPAVTAFAEESAAPAETAETSELESLRLKKEEAQAVYDAALNDKLLAEDVVENAKRAVKDAQEEYDRVMERYSTGFAGFLQWVIETETDPVKVEDAECVLESYFAGDINISADDPENITRMLYTTYWMEDVAEYFRTYYGIEPGTSHAAMSLAQFGVNKENEWYDLYNEAAVESGEYPSSREYAFNEIELESTRVHATRNDGFFKGVWDSGTDIAAEQQEGIPLFEGFKEHANGLPYGTGFVLKRKGYQNGRNFFRIPDDGEELFMTEYFGDLETPLPLGKEEAEGFPILSGEDTQEPVSYPVSEFYEYPESDGIFIPSEKDTQELVPFSASLVYEILEPQVVYMPSEEDMQELLSYLEYLDSDINEVRKPETWYCLITDLYDMWFWDKLRESPPGDPTWDVDEAGSVDIDYTWMFQNNILQFIDLAKGITIGEAFGVDRYNGNNFNVGSVFNGEGTYTIDEYVRALREYYSIIDPAFAKAVLDVRNDDMDAADKQLAGAEEALQMAYGKLKGSEKEYEEAVAGFAGHTEIPSEEAGAALEVTYAGQWAVAAEQADQANVINGSQNTAVTELSSDQYEISTTQDSAAAATVSDADPAGISPEAEETGQDVFADGTFSEQISPESSVVSEQREPENEAVETYSAAERQPEDTLTANVPDEVNRVTGTVDNSEINKADSANAVTVSEETEENQDISIEKDKQKNGLLAEVLSYIFNGGAIAFILPAGFKRRKRNKSTGGILQGDF